MKRLSKWFTLTAFTGAFAFALAFGGSMAIGAYDAYFKITVDQYQCGNTEDPDTGATVFAIYGTGGAEWSYPDDTSISARLELLSPYASVLGDETYVEATGDTGSYSGVDATFPVDPEGYPVILKFTSTTSVGGVPTYRQTLTLTCTAEGPAIPTETEGSPMTPGITVDAQGGSSVTVNGTGFPGDEEVTIDIESVRTPLGTVTTSSAGTFSATFAIPCAVGNGPHTIIATIVSTKAEASAPVNVSGCTATTDVPSVEVAGSSVSRAPASVSAQPNTTG